MNKILFVYRQMTLAMAFILAFTPVDARVVASHVSNVDPMTEGWELEIQAPNTVTGGTESTPSGQYEYWQTADVSSAGGSYVNYRHYLAPSLVEDPWTVEATVRVVSGPLADGWEVGNQVLLVHDGFTNWGIRLAEGSVTLQSTLNTTAVHSTSFDTQTDYHTYRMVFEPNGPGRDDDTANIYIDDRLVFAQVPRADFQQASLGSPFVTFGSGNSVPVSTLNWNTVSFHDIDVTSLTEKYKLDTGIFSTCATDENGAHCWGNASVGSIPAHSNVVDIRTATWQTSCLIDDTGLSCWGDSSTGVIPAPYVQNAISIDTSIDVACALTSGGLLCWGNGAGSLASAPTFNNPRDIELGFGGNGGIWGCVLDDSGVQCWGDNTYGQTDVPELINPRQVSTGSHSACALDDTGVVCWGDNRYGANNPPPLSNPMQVSAGLQASCAIDDTGVVCWGTEDLPDCSSSNCGPGYDYGFLDIPPLNDPFRVSVGYTHICALDRTGAVCWGRNSVGEADNQSLEFSLSNTTVAQLTDVSDINSNGVGEIAVLDSGPDGRLRMRIRDGASDTLLADIDFGTDVAIAVESIRDLDFSGNPEIAVLGRRPDGQVRVQIRDSVSGNLVRNLFYGSTYAPVSMRVIDDYNGNSAPEIAVMGSDSTDAIRVQVQDSGTGAILDNVFLGNQGIGQDFVAVSDTSGNGMPELGILSVLKANDQVRLQVWDAVDATFQINMWFGKVYQPFKLMTMPDINGNGSEEIVAVGVDPATRNIRVQVRDSATAATLYNIWLGNTNQAVDIVLINDINSDGVSDLAVLLKTPGSTGRVRVQSGLDGTFIRNLFYTVVENPVGLAVMPDYNGNGFDELAVLGESADIRHVQVLDTATGTQVNRIDFGSVAPPSLTLTVQVINDDGGTASEADWTVTAVGLDAASPKAGTYDLIASGPAGYAQTSLTCSNSGDVQVTAVTIDAGEVVTCTFVFDDTGWQPGVFLDESTYALRCATPGNSRNIFTDGCPAVQDVQGAVLDENNFLRSWSNRTYLWYDEIVDRDPGLYDDPLQYFGLLKTTALSPTGAPKDKFHFTYQSLDYCQLSQGGVSAGYGATWSIVAASPPRQIIVAYTEPNTPATANGILRGAEILEVDGAAVSNGDAATLNAGLFPSALGEAHTFTVRDPDGTVRQVTMTSQQITNAMVQNVDVINTPTGDVGYMTFNYHRAPAEEELIDAINALQGVDDLVLDIRYNGGGFLDIAAQLAYMIAGPAQTAGRTFELIQFNDKYPVTNPVTGRPITPTPFHDETLGFSVAAGQALPTLNLSRVFVLTGGGTCSASEAVMNGLRGVGVEVIQIGTTSCGKPYGFYAQENCGTTYFSIQFRGVNDANYGDYTDGFTPSPVDDGEANVLGCLVADDLSQQLGNPAENRLEVALAYQAGQGCTAPVGAASGDVAGKASIKPNTSDGEIYRSFFDSNRILGRP